MMMRIHNRILYLLMLLIGATYAVDAGAIELADLDGMEQFVSCATKCREGRRALLYSCLEKCPVSDPAWEKDRQEPIDENDIYLAWLEYWDDGKGTHVCYEGDDGDVVVPFHMCGYEACVEQYGEEHCKDEDGDGLRGWQEDAIGSSDDPAAGRIDRPCRSDADCGGYGEFCSDESRELISTSLCAARECEGGTCTAFHLESIAVDNTELIVHVHYDYSPVPARVLELLVEYDSAALTLVDSRRLPLLKDAKKDLHTVHPSESRVRLIVVGKASSRPVPNGPIIELVFHRKNASGSGRAVAFSENDYAQKMSMAPDPGRHRDALQDDALWGDEISMSYAGPDSDRLLLYYSFDNRRLPLDYADVETADELCALWSECGNLDESKDLENTRKIKLKGQLASLQRGGAVYGESIEGVSGRAAYFDGRDDHLELPVTMNRPYESKDQSFSFSTWFYVEGGSQHGALEGGQVLFSHANNAETSRFSLLVRPVAADPEQPSANGKAPAQLIWVEDSLRDGAVGQKMQVISEALSVETWTHLGMRVDAEDGRAEFVVNGEEVGSVTLNTPPSVIGCPAFSDDGSEKLALHEEGEALPGSGAASRVKDRLFYASSKDNLYGISQMDLSGLEHRQIIREPGVSSADPDYLPALDKLVYSSNSSGSFEIWIADGSGENARQITKGFGDTARGIFARRPKWAPDGSAIVFESNIYDKATNDNFWARGYHLYYLGYNPEKNQVEIPQAQGGVASELNYDFLAPSGAIAFYRLTQPKVDTMSFTNALWLRGRFTTGEGESEEEHFGELVANARDMLDKKKMGVHRIVIPARHDYPENLFNIDPEEIVTNDGQNGSELKALAAYHSNAAGGTLKSHLFYKISRPTFGSELYMKDLLSGADSVPFSVTEGGLEQIQEAAFSPDGSQLALSGIENARPALVVTRAIEFGANSASAAGIDKISDRPMRTRGLSWKNFERIYPCNWVGASRDKTTHRIFGALRGGMDELRMYSYLRTNEAFLSDAERGFEQLKAAGRDSTVDSHELTCSGSHTDCPEHHLCIDGKCTIRTCGPENDYRCEDGGSCTLAPVSMNDVEWVCSAECSSDKQCYEQECLNGPCGICDSGSSSCMECEQVEENVGGLELSYIAGCPDRNSFRCEEGSCLTDCYAIEDGESKYLCEPGFEYCEQGRCVAFDWSWKDFGPMTFSGLGEVRVEHPTLPRTTAALPQLYPVKIKAYGVGDYLNPPQVLVEGKHPGVHGGDWFELGTVSVRNKTEAEAKNSPYTVTTGFPVEKVRLRLVTPAYTDMNRTAEGPQAGNGFCKGQDCARRASGSRSTLGYKLDITDFEKRRQCLGRKAIDLDYPGNCTKLNDVKAQYLMVGYPTAIVLDVEVSGDSVMKNGQSKTNTICSYEGTAAPLDGERFKRLYYGDVARELSNQKDAFYKDAVGPGLIPFEQSWALLNCDYAVSDADMARLELEVSERSFPSLGQGALRSGNITETANQCTFEVDENRIEPCYEWVGSGPSLDVMREDGAEQLYGELEFSEFRSFGYDASTFGF